MSIIVFVLSLFLERDAIDLWHAFMHDAASDLIPAPNEYSDPQFLIQLIQLIQLLDIENEPFDI